MAEDFYAALHRHGRDLSHLQTLLKKGTGGTPKLLPFFERLYNSLFANAAALDHSSYLIPKKNHQIWLGKEMPGKYFSYVQTWAEALGWEYRLWGDADAEKVLQNNRDLYQLGKNYGEKSDILRLEVLYQEGGLYVDVDAECLNVDFFDHLHRTLTFYAGFEPLEHRWLGISNALIGSTKEHPLLRKMILDLRSHFFSNEHQWAVVKTGPKFVTNVIGEFIQDTSASKICIFPSSYF